MGRRKCLTKEQESEIYELYTDGSQTMSQIARMYKVSQTTVSKIIEGGEKMRVKKKSFGTAMPEDWIQKVQDYVEKRNEQDPYHRFSTATLLMMSVDQFMETHPNEEPELVY